MGERERFEKWARGKLQLDFLKHRTGGGYLYSGARVAFETWQAAKADAAEERAALVAEVEKRDEQIKALREALEELLQCALQYKVEESDPCVDDAREALAATAPEQGGVRVRFQEAEGATEVGPANIFTTPLDELDGGWRSMESAPRDGTPIRIRRSTEWHEEAEHVVMWDEDHGENGWWVVHDGKFDHPLRGGDPEGWKPVPLPPPPTRTAEGE